MLNTLTYAVRVETTPDQTKTLSDTCSAYLDCCNIGQQDSMGAQDTQPENAQPACIP